MFEKFEHTFDIKSIDKENRVIQGVASLEVVDRDNEIIALDAITSSLNTFLRNPVIRFKHQDPIGRAIPEQTYVDYNKKAFIVTAHITDGTEIARDAWALINDGIVKSFSVGGKVLEKEAVKMGDREVEKITDMELYEVSVVDIPSNRESFFSVISKSIQEDVEKQRMRDEIAQELFNKPYSQLDDDQKKKVHQEALKRRGGKPGEGRQSHDYGKDAEMTVQKPFAGYTNFAECVADQKKKGKSDESAKKICGKLQSEHEKKDAEMDLGKPGKKKHSAKWHRCVNKVRRLGGVKSPEAVCTAALGDESYGSAILTDTKDYSTQVGQKVGREDDSKNKEGVEAKCLKKSKLKSSPKASLKLSQSQKQESQEKSLLEKLRERLLTKLQTR